MPLRLYLSALTAILCIAPDLHADERTGELAHLLIAPDRIDALYFQALHARDESATDSFDLSDSVVPLLDHKKGEAGERYSTSVTLLRRSAETVNSLPARLTSEASQIRLALEAELARESIAAKTLLLLGRRRGDSQRRQYEVHLLRRRHPHYAAVLAHFGLSGEHLRPRCSGLDTAVRFKRDRRPSRALKKFLPVFDRLKARGFVRTRRRGSTGIGYTLESLLKIPENNLRSGDFLGMEIKSHRDSEFRASSSRRMNLFLKEPRWIDGLSHRQRIPKYGYVDDNGRQALYSTVTVRENAHELAARVDREKRRVWLRFRGEPVAYWTFEILAGRLQEKLRETVFVGASTRRRGHGEEFHYNSVQYCRRPSVERFVSLLDHREVVIEMRMHLKPGGSARNHGTAFRVRQNRIPRLYAVTVQCRRHGDNARSE